MKSQKRTIKIVLLALMASLILLTTLISMPTAIGYYHLGDGFIFASAALLGPYAGLAATIGSVLADILTGYAFYAPATAIIKGGMGLLAGLFLRKNQKLIYTVIVLFLCELMMVGGYFLYEILIYDLAGAISSLIPNMLQGFIGIVLGTITVPLSRKIPLSNKYLK